MKRFLCGIILALTLALGVSAQQPVENISVPKNLLTQQQLEQIKQVQLQEKAQAYGKWVGVGHELGVAINESLSAVTTQANNFAQTPVGKLTAFLVVWKVIGREAMGFFIGISIVIVALPLWIWSYRKYLPHNVVAAETFDATTKHRTGRTYKVVNDPDDRNNENANGFIIGHYVMLAVLFACVAVTMWGCN